MTGSPVDLLYAPIKTVTHSSPPSEAAVPFTPAINSAVASVIKKNIGLSTVSKLYVHYRITIFLITYGIYPNS